MDVKFIYNTEEVIFTEKPHVLLTSLGYINVRNFPDKKLIQTINTLKNFYNYFYIFLLRLLDFYIQKNDIEFMVYETNK